MRKIFFLLTASACLFGETFLGALDVDGLNLNKVFSGTKKVAQGMMKVSDKDEIALGREVASYLCARYGLVRDPALTKYVGLVGRTVAQGCDRPEIPYHFGILNTDEVNAYAGPGGYIFITKGLLRGLKDESELAGALGHEIAHVARRHVAKEIQKGNLIQGGVELASAREESPEAFKAVSDFSIKLLFKGFSRGDERESDQKALSYAATAGYTPAGFQNLLNRLAAEKSGETRLKALNKSHPPSSDRARLVQREIETEKWDLSLPANEPRFLAAVAALK
ncbi:MAG TPA: M48 family metalloprotease [Elusimicrobiota bacterium]|nr:M48 family metalloprotease [Elusimicrobiota bacterium]